MYMGCELGCSPPARQFEAPIRQCFLVAKSLFIMGLWADWAFYLTVVILLLSIHLVIK
jgi:hypothetical protein